MNKELTESVKLNLIQILNQNIRLEEATKTSGSDNSKYETSGGTQTAGQIPERKDDTPEGNKPLNWDDVLMGSQSKKFDMTPTKALGMAAGGKLTGFLGRLGGQKIANMFGNKIGGGLGDVMAKVTSDVETLSGAPGMEAQIGDIARAQVAGRWSGAGYTPPDGWFRPIVPQTGVEPIEPETAEDRAVKRRAARAARIQDVKLSGQEARYGLSPLP